jgi:hypothetical protein
MSNLFKSQANPNGAPFFPVPQVLVKSDLLRLMSYSQLKLYIFLLAEAERKSTAALEFSNQDVRQKTGLSPASLRRARTKLWENGLVDSIAKLGECFLYVVHDPVKCQPAKAIPEKFRGTYEASKRPTDTLRSPSWEELGTKKTA